MLGRQHGVVVKKQALKSGKSLFDPTHHHRPCLWGNVDDSLVLQVLSH